MGNHYAWMTTEKYRSRYGLLAFACAAGSRLTLPVQVTLHDTERTEIQGELDNNPCRPSVFVEEQEYRLPREVVWSISHAGEVGQPGEPPGQ